MARRLRQADLHSKRGPTDALAAAATGLVNSRDDLRVVSCAT